MRVLIVQLSSLGDVVDAMPVVHDVLAAHADATVDWVAEPRFGGLLRRVHGIGEVVDAPLRGWRQQWWNGRARAEWSGARAKLHRQAYDAIVDLQGTTRSALVARLAKGRRFAPAGATEAPARWLADRTVALPPQLHPAERARQLAALALGYPLSGPPDHGLRGRLQKLAQPTVVFAHGSSRGATLWPEARWVALGRRFVDAGWQVVLPHGDEFEQVRAERLAAAIDSEVIAFGKPRDTPGPVVQVWPRLALDALADRLGATYGVVGADGGVSRLALALGLPHLQLQMQRPAGRAAHAHPQQRSVGGETLPSVEDVWTAWQPIGHGR